MICSIFHNATSYGVNSMATFLVVNKCISILILMINCFNTKYLVDTASQFYFCII